MLPAYQCLMDMQTEPTPSPKRALFLFAPKFREFGADVAKELIARGVCEVVDGICTGGREVVNLVRDRLDDKAGFLWDLEREELQWMDQPANTAILSDMEAELGPGIVGLTITSDRRIGCGLVSGGRIRPSWLADAAKNNPINMPVDYVAGLYAFLDGVIQQVQPRLVFLYGVAGAPAFLLGQICIARNIPVLRLLSSRVGARMIIDSDPIGRFQCVKSTMARARSGELDLASERRWAREYLENFRKQPSQPEYFKYNREKIKEKKPLRQFLHAAKSSISFIFSGNAHTHPFSRDRIRRAWFQAHLSFRRVTQSNKYCSSTLPDQCNCVYFPLQFEPEASTMVLAPWHTNQIAVIEALAKALPAGFILVVKEHASMRGGRPKNFYRQIAAIPRTILVGDERAGLWWIGQAKLTTVISGTSAWEAVRLGKPVLVIGDTPFLAIGEGMFHEPCLAKLAGALKKAIQQPPASDESLELFLAALRASSFEMKPSLLWGRYADHAADQQRNAVVDICDSIMARLDESVNLGGI